MDLQIIQENIPLFVKGMKVTVTLGAIGIVLSILFGFMIALFRFFKVPILTRILTAYIELSRNTPLLIQLFFLYYGLPKLGIPLAKELAAIIGLTFLGAAYMAEVFRASFESVSQIQLEVGRSLGFNGFQLATVVLLPQGMKLAIPSVGANCIFLLKETSVFSAIAIMDLTNVTKDLIGMYYMTREFLLMLVVSYSILIIPMVVILYWLEKSVGGVSAGS
ncbi:amino acid ABC transporter permease [Enterococcus sp. CSURQ0835]|uniref:amino acid ABC transporter permease n=1 Tax=Enterococcus sp. CSURQ0835 TaxID=2681394 RepID=UPI001359793B|nr:amino acid ABC transporter permease [Enterococcus sp. CSURQ0835]